MNRGSLGIRELNVRLQTELNPAMPEYPSVEMFGWQFRVRDKIIQTENNCDKEVFNGDTGQIETIDPVEPTRRPGRSHSVRMSPSLPLEVAQGN